MEVDSEVVLEVDSDQTRAFKLAAFVDLIYVLDVDSGHLLWRLTPNSSVPSCSDYIVDGSGVLEVDSKQTRPLMLGLCC